MYVCIRSPVTKQHTPYWLNADKDGIESQVAGGNCGK
jgi:hypothetical protein